MKSITLDGALMPTKEAAHAYLKEALEFPEYYGANLDALYDILSERRRRKLEVILVHGDALRESLGEYGEELIACFTDAFTRKGGAVFREE